MPDYPASVKTFTTRNTGDTIEGSHVNDLQDEVNAIEAGLLNATAPLNSSNSTVANLVVTGGSTLRGGLVVSSGASTFSSNVQFAAPSTFGGAVTFSSGLVTISSRLQVAGVSTFGGAVTFSSGQVVISSNLSVIGGSTMGALIISGTLQSSNSTAVNLQVTGDSTFTGGVVCQGSISFSGTESVTLSTGNTNNLSVASTTTYLRLTGNSSGSTLTGISLGQSSGRLMCISMVASSAVITHNDAGSISSNRFALANAANMTFDPGDGQLFIYDGVQGFWRPMSI